MRFYDAVHNDHLELDAAECVSLAMGYVIQDLVPNAETTAERVHWKDQYYVMVDPANSAEKRIKVAMDMLAQMRIRPVDADDGGEN